MKITNSSLQLQRRLVGTSLVLVILSENILKTHKREKMLKLSPISPQYMHVQ